MEVRRGFWKYLRFQVLLMMLVVLLIPLGCVGWVYYKTLSDDLGKIERSHALEVSDSANRLLDQLGEQLSGTVITNAKWGAFLDAYKAGDIKWIEENVNVSLDIIPHLSFVATVDENGEIISQQGKVADFTKQLKEISILEKIKQTPDVFGIIQMPEGLAIMAASRITDEQGNESSGILIFGRMLDDEAMKGVGKILNAGMAIRSSTGQTLATDEHTASLLARGANDSSALPQAGAAASFRSGTHDGKRFGEVSSGFPGFTGQSVAELVVAVPAEASGTVQKEMIRLSGIAGGLAVVLILLIAVMLHRRIVVPLVGFERFLDEVADGQLSVQLPDKVRRRGDEIGSIARSLMEMVEHLKQLVTGIRSTASDSSSAATRLTGETDAAASGANRIADSMREVAAGADSQAQGMKRGAEVTREIQTSMMIISDRTASVAAVSEQATQQAEEGNQIVTLAVEQMERIAASAGNSVSEAFELHEKSEQIGKMVEAISGIAYRTNLLALNANIEASRAGEHGRGFAVVAGEVRKLASQSDQTAAEIRREVEAIQSVIASVKAKIEDGYRETQSGATIVKDAGNAFRNISEGVKDMEAELREISSASQEIGAQVEELSALVDQTEAISESSAQRSQDVADIAESQMGSVRMVADAMVSLSKRIRDLELEVNRFKL
ncbi:methyl-accepting chemotaxis protein [Cohnella endophytica]|nr:methyl-accepting chemotaxis protein [Cohnella endophytica]